MFFNRLHCWKTLKFLSFFRCNCYRWLYLAPILAWSLQSIQASNVWVICLIIDYLNFYSSKWISPFLQWKTCPIIWAMTWYLIRFPQLTHPFKCHQYILMAFPIVDEVILLPYKLVHLTTRQTLSNSDTSRAFLGV